MKLETCPSEDQLKAHLLGEVSGENAEAMDQRLESCESCAKREEGSCLVRAEALNAADPLMSALGSGPVKIDADEEAVSKIIANASTLRGELDSTHSHKKSVREKSTSDVDLSFLSPSLDDDELGRLGPFRILEVLGVGGMGVVLKAEDPNLSREVALKVMKPEIAAGPVAKQRFLREARATAAIDHDNIVTIHQVDEDGGVPYLAMPFLKGESLRDRLGREKKLPLRDLLKIAKEVAAGLASAHAAGLIHRDIKPDNIWLEDRSSADQSAVTATTSKRKKYRVKIVDFGLARSDDDINITQSGAIMGTPRYMAPEQAKGEVADHRTDLFSLGAVLYHLAAGRGPFDRQGLAATLFAVINDTPKPIADLRPDLPTELSELIDKLLQKDANDRPQSAEVVANVVNQIVRDRISKSTILDPAPKPPKGPGEKKKPKKPKNDPTRSPRGKQSFNPWLIGLAALAPVFLVWGIVLLFDTPEGTLRVEVNGNDIEVLVDNETIKLKDGKAELDTDAKLHGLKLKLAGAEIPFDPKAKEFVLDEGEISVTLGKTELRSNSFELTKNRTTVLRVDFIPVMGLVKNNEVANQQSDKKRVSNQSPDWVSLFDGKTLNGWSVYGQPGWSVQNGDIVCRSDNSKLVSDAEVPRDFDLQLECWLGKGTNTGIFLRTGRNNRHTDDGYEVQLAEFEKFGTGSIWDRAAFDRKIVDDNEWFKVEVQVRDNNIAVFINGQQTVNYTDTNRDFRSGFIALQGHRKTGDVRFRNIRLKDLTKPAPNVDWIVGNWKFIEHSKGHTLNVEFRPDGTSVGELTPETVQGMLRRNGHPPKNTKGSGRWSKNDDDTYSISFGQLDEAPLQIRVVPTGNRLFAKFESGMWYRLERTATPSATDDNANTQPNPPATKSPLQVGAVFTGHEHPVKCLAFTPDGKRVVSACNGDKHTFRGRTRYHTRGPHNNVIVWDVGTGQQIRVFKIDSGSKYGPQAIDVSPDGRTLAVGAGWFTANGPSDPRVYLWDIASGQPKFRTAGPGNQTMRDVAFSQDGANVVVLRSSFFQKRNVANGELESDLRLQAQGEFGRSRLAPNLKYAVGVAELKSKEIVAWDLDHGGMMKSFRGHTAVPTDIAVSNDSRLVLSCASDFSIRVWDFEKETEAGKIDNLNSKPSCVAFSPDARYILAGFVDGTVALYETSTKRELARIAGHEGTIREIAFSQDGTQAVSGGEDRTVRLWNLSVLPKTPVSTASAQIRQTAARIFELGGFVRFVNNRQKSAYRLADLPQEDFIIDHVGYANKHLIISGEHVSVLSGFPQLKTVYFGQTKLTDAAVAELAKLKNVEEVYVKKCNFNNAHLVQLKSLPKLEMMELFHTELTNDGLNVLAEFPALRRLTLENASKAKFGDPIINDAGLVHLANCKKLEVLWLMGPNFTDAAVDHLVNVNSLKSLNIGAHDITEEGFEELKRRMHDGCKVSLTSRLTNPGNDQFLPRSVPETNFEEKGTVINTKVGTTSMAVSPDGKLIATSSSDELEKITIWDATTGKIAVQFNTPGDFTTTATQMSFSPDSQSLLMVVGQTVNTVSAADGKLVSHIDFPGPLKLVVFPKQTIAAAVFYEKPGHRTELGDIPQLLRIWNWKTGEVLTDEKLAIEGGHLRYVNVSPDERFLVTCQQNTATQHELMLDGDEASLGKRVDFEYVNRIRSKMVFSNDGKYAAFSIKGTGGMAAIFDTETRQVLHLVDPETAKQENGGYVYGCQIVFTNDGSNYVTADHTGRIAQWETETGTLVREIGYLKNSGSHITPQIAMTTENRIIAAGGEVDPRLIILNKPSK